MILTLICDHLLGSERVACPPPPTKQGIYSNGECTLVKLRISETNNKTAEMKNDGDSTPVFCNREFVLVVSQYSQKDEFNFTIKVYSRVHTTLTQLPSLISPNSGWISCYRKVLEIDRLIF